jgi:hypothetical protein
MNPIGDPLSLLSLLLELNFAYLKNEKASWEVKNPSEAPYYDLLGTRSHTPSMGEFGVIKSCYLPNIRINTALLGNIKDTIIFNI